MNTNIWEELKRPFYILAPMEDVTDSVFRQVIIETGRPDLFFTEFTSCEGMLATKGLDVVTHRLEYEDKEHPIIAQIWGKTPEAYLLGAQKVRKLGFDGVDINMGCPVKKIVKQGCCSALINNHELAHEIIEATKEGASELPVSVKTRIGFDKIVTEDWFSFLLDHKLDAVTVHGRTVAQLSKAPNNWEEIGKVVELRDRSGFSTKIVGNGDVVDLEQADGIVKKYMLDGIMIGRGVFQNPWVFSREIRSNEITVQMRKELLLLHLELFENKWNERKNFHIMKKFFKIYVRDFNGAAEVREHLMSCNDYEEARKIINNEIITI